MTRAMTNRMDGVVWDFVYQAVLIALGVVAVAAVVLQISNI